MLMLWLLLLLLKLKDKEQIGVIAICILQINAFSFYSHVTENQQIQKGLLTTCASKENLKKVKG